jgi:hypothetical protein
MFELPSFTLHSRQRRRHPSAPGRALVLAALVALGALAGHLAARAQGSSFIDVVSRSGFIFLGTVKSAGGAAPNAPGPYAGSAGAASAVVTVDRILEALPPVGNFTGREVNVRLREPQRMKAGDRAVFFTYLQSAGKTLGLVEVASEPAGQEQGMQQRIREARLALADRALAARLSSAQLVVVGVFGEGRPTPEAREHRSEHDPLWWRAPIRVESFEKGSASEQPVYALYANSDDVVWRDAPKPRPGQEGIFLLQPDREKRFRTAGLFLIDPLDALPKGELERVRRLLKAAR